MAKHFRIEFTEEDKITAVIGIEAPENDVDFVEAELTIDCPDSAPNVALGLKVALMAIEKYTELMGAVPGRLN